MDHAGIREKEHGGAVRRLFARFGARALDLALPPLCAGCRDPVGDHGALCPACWSQVAFISAPVCERLGVPLPFDMGPGALSPAAIADPPDFDRARAAFRFEGVGRDLIHALKFADRLDLAPMIAGWMTSAGRDLLADADAILPVPLHWTRLFTRRFNQSAELARAIALLSGLPHEPLILRRARRTHRQIGLTRSQRRDNVQGAFAVSARRRAWVQGKRLVLVDDVYTTGATIEACARVLRRAGAMRVDVLTAARVVDAPIAIHMT